MKLPRLALGFFALIAMAGTAWAAPPVHVRGTIEAISGQVLTVKTRDGASEKIALAKDWDVLLVSPVPLSSIKPQSFIGTAALPAADGRLRALEVVVFPAFARGLGEGHYPWDLMPRSSMTNATVGTVTGQGANRVLTVRYKGGEQTILVPEGVPIVTFAPAARDLAKPGAKIFLSAMKQADGSLAAKNILVGKDGLTPPM